MFQLYTRPTLALRMQDHQPFQELTYLETNQEVAGVMGLLVRQEITVQN